MKSSSLLIILSVATAVFAATLPRNSFPPGHVDKVIDASEYLAGGNGTTVGHGTLIRRAQGDVYLCTGASWSGYCVLITGASSGGCVNLASDLNNLVSSFGPDDGQDCYLYDGFNCLKGGIGAIRSPGIKDMSIFGFNDQLSSYKCIFSNSQSGK